MSNNFTESIRWFRKFVDVESSTKKTADAYFRLGDAYFLTNDYQRAIEFYKSAQLQNVFDVDYAIYQQLICHGLINQSIQQKSLLNLLINEYPNSPYHDDALMQLGDILINTNGETKEGVKQLNDLIHLHPNSSLVKSAYLKLGLYYYNIDENDKAILNFKKVVTNFPSTKQAKEALMAYKNVSVEMGSVKDYLSFVDGLSNLNVSRSAQDSITFEAAETLFFKQDFLKSSIAFEDYLSLFDQPIFKNSAYFYLSESYFELEKFDQALDNYLLLNELNDSRYVERVLSQIAFIEFEKKQYGIAALHFKQLIDIAQNKESKRSAIISLFLCNKELGVEKEIIKSSEQILSLDKVDQQILVEAKLILANVLYDKSEFYAAKKEYLSICNQTNNSFGAESKYKLALLSFTAEDYQSVESSIFDLAENYSDEYFIAKGFILLSDLYVKQENYFQAKATLESIVENYEGDDLKNLAILKLEQLKSLEEDQKPINEPQLIIELLNDIDFDEEENLLENEE
jgi:TolA-binding protein